MREVSLTHPVLSSFLRKGVYLTPPMLDSFLFGLASFYVGSFSYTSLAGFIFMWGVSLTHPMLASFLSGQFPLHIPSWVHFYLAILCYTSHAGFTFLRGVSLTHPMLHPPPPPPPLFFFFFLNSRGVSLTHPVPSSFSSGSFLLNILFCLHFYVGSFSYTSHADFVLMWGVSLTNPVLLSSHTDFFFF